MEQQSHRLRGPASSLKPRNGGFVSPLYFLYPARPRTHCLWLHQPEMCIGTLLSIGLIPTARRKAWGLIEHLIMKVQRQLKHQVGHLVPLSSFSREQTGLYKSLPRTHCSGLIWLWHDLCLPEGSVKKPPLSLPSTISHCFPNCLHEVPPHQKPYKLNVQFKIRPRKPPGDFISLL